MHSEVDSKIAQAVAAALEPAILEVVDRAVGQVIEELRRPPKRLLTLNETADCLSISRATLGRLRREGRIKEFRLLDSPRFRPEDIEEFLEGGGEAGMP